MEETKKVEPTKVEVIEPEKPKENLVRRGINAGTRCCSAMKRIFMSIAAAVMGWKGSAPGILAKFGAGFLTVLGWLFFSIAWTPSLAYAMCETGAGKLIGEEEYEGEECSKESSQQ